MQKRRPFKFLNKKGTLSLRQSLMHLGMIGLAIVVLVLSLNYVKSIEKDTEFQKLFLSRDIALLTNTMYSLPGEIKYTYSFGKLDLSKFKIELKPLRSTDDIPIVRVEDNGIGKNYPYGKPSQSEYQPPVDGAKSIEFSKKDSKFTITKNE